MLIYVGDSSYVLFYYFLFLLITFITDIETQTLASILDCCKYLIIVTAFSLVLIPLFHQEALFAKVPMALELTAIPSPISKVFGSIQSEAG